MPIVAEYHSCATNDKGEARRPHDYLTLTLALALTRTLTLSLTLANPNPYPNPRPYVPQVVDPVTGEVIPCCGGEARPPARVLRGRTAKELQACNPAA
eukprot:scaffold35029_cov54-Phaeocystis_antarctica.AAC.4